MRTDRRTDVTNLAAYRDFAYALKAAFVSREKQQWQQDVDSSWNGSIVAARDVVLWRRECENKIN